MSPPRKRGHMPTAGHNVYFSDVFDIAPEEVDEYGAFNIALVNDLPLFIDPFLLYDSKDSRYQRLHEQIIEYLCFLKERALSNELTEGAVSHWLLFKEVKQNWLGFSESGNSGTGLGPEFARNLSRNLTTVFRDFGNETISAGSHIEKLGLLSGGVGRDHLSDFTTNLIKGYLLQFTESFAREHLKASKRRSFNVGRVSFDFQTGRWKNAEFDLPFFNGDYVLLTPKEILTRDESWINQGDMLDQFTHLCAALPDDHLRAQIDEHFRRQITKKSSEKQRRQASLKTIEQFHQVLDYYIRAKEKDGASAHKVSSQKVLETHEQFVRNIKAFIDDHLASSDFYRLGTSYEASLKRVQYLKHVIEDQDGNRLFYVKGKPVQREVDLHVMYRLTWFAAEHDVNAEVNNGRGPVDFKVSKGKRDASLVEFKLAKNTSLEKNLQHQVKVYEKASDARRSIKAILYFSDGELMRVKRILKRLGLENREDVVLIDASKKAPGSKADES